MWRAIGIFLIFATPALGQEFFTLKGHGGPIMDIAVAPSGQIATASFDNSVGIWTGTTPRWLDGHMAAVTVVTFVDDMNIVSAADDFAVVRWDLTTNRVTRLVGHQGKIAGLAVSPDSSLIASASWDGSIGLWPIAGGDPRFLMGHGQGVNDIAFSNGGAALYSASTDGTIREWDVVTGTEVRVLVKHGFGVNKIIIEPNGRWLAYGAVDGVTRIVDLEYGQAIADFTLDRRPILSMAYHAPSHLLAVGDGEGFIMIIDARSRKIIRDFRATLRGPVWALAFAPDGQNIHAGGLDDAMYSFPLETMEEVPQMVTSVRSFLEKPQGMSNGERQFKRKCSICHTTSAGSMRRAGPSLHSLFGRQAGSVVDYKYSQTLRGSDIIWSEDTIDALFDLGPDHYIPGSKMPMQRIAKAQDRRDLINYLRDATQQKESE